MPRKFLIQFFGDFFNFIKMLEAILTTQWLNYTVNIKKYGFHIIVIVVVNIIFVPTNICFFVEGATSTIQTIFFFFLGYIPQVPA